MSSVRPQDPAIPSQQSAKPAGQQPAKAKPVQQQQPAKAKPVQYSKSQTRSN